MTRTANGEKNGDVGKIRLQYGNNAGTNQLTVNCDNGDGEELQAVFFKSFLLYRPVQVVFQRAVQPPKIGERLGLLCVYLLHTLTCRESDESSTRNVKLRGACNSRMENSANSTCLTQIPYSEFMNPINCTMLHALSVMRYAAGASAGIKWIMKFRVACACVHEPGSTKAAFP